MAWPTTSNPRKEFVTLRLSKEEADDLDNYLVPRYGGNRSAAVRALLREATAKARRKASMKAQPTGGQEAK